MKIFTVVFLLAILCWQDIECENKPDFSVVFVHIGERLPSYIFDALKQVRLFNKTCVVYVLASDQALDRTIKSFFESYKITCVHYQQVPLSEEHAAFLAKTKYTKFWLRTSERFFVLYDFIKQNHLRNIIHLENDVMVYVDLNMLLPVFIKKYDLAIPFDNDNRSIASLVYIKDDQSLKKLIDVFVAQAGAQLNDMQIPPLLRKKSPESIGSLPIIVPAYVKQHCLKSARGDSVACPHDYMNNFALLNCIFDAAAIGQYLGGTDPSVLWSPPGFINESCIFDPSLCTYKWCKDACGRAAPYMVFGGRMYCIANLHVHSKKLDRFGSKRGPCVC